MKAMIHAQDRVPNFRDEVKIVSHHEDRHGLFELSEGLDELLFDGKVDVCSRFVQKKQLRFTSERSRDENALPLTTG